MNYVIEIIPSFFFHKNLDEYTGNVFYLREKNVLGYLFLDTNKMVLYNIGGYINPSEIVI